MNGRNEIVVYNLDGEVKLDVRLEDETVWLTQAQIVVLFDSSKANVSEHIKNIYEQHELEFDSTVRKIRTVQKEGARNVSRDILFYNLDAIISIGFRINTKRGIQFRQWANNIIKDYLLKGYSINQRFEQLEHRVTETENKIEFFVRTSLPPVEGIFYEGQIFDAYSFVSNLICSAQKQITLIDNYVDYTVFSMLDKRQSNVEARIYTRHSNNLCLDIKKHNEQYKPIDIRFFEQAHDRFLIVDDVVYHIGASLKDLGKKWFAFSKMLIPASEILNKLSNFES